MSGDVDLRGLLRSAGVESIWDVLALDRSGPEFAASMERLRKAGYLEPDSLIPTEKGEQLTRLVMESLGLSVDEACALAAEYEETSLVLNITLVQVEEEIARRRAAESDQ